MLGFKIVVPQCGGWSEEKGRKTEAVEKLFWQFQNEEIGDRAEGSGHDSPPPLRLQEYLPRGF